MYECMLFSRATLFFFVCTRKMKSVAALWPVISSGNVQSYAILCGCAIVCCFGFMSVLDLFVFRRSEVFMEQITVSLTL